MNQGLRDRFIEFSRLKLAADGSDAYIMGAVVLALESDDPYWYAGCFTTSYAPPTQEVLVRRFARCDLLHRPKEVLGWAVQHWDGLPISGARRTNRMGPHKFVDTLAGYAQWLDSGGVEGLNRTDFDAAFKQLLGGVPNHGRYTGLKLYETLRRIGADIPPVSDIRPRGGRTPRRSLSAIFGHDHRSDTTAASDEANTLADGLRSDVPTTWFNVEMLLCNFSKAVKGTFYPGHALDRELSRVASVRGAFGEREGSGTMRVRRMLYPDECLGEIGGWTGVRKELEETLPRYGYLWSDRLYDFGRTVDVSRPVKRAREEPLRLLCGTGEERPHLTFADQTS